MSKSTVDRLFVGAIVAVVAGWVVAIVAIVAALAGGVVVIGGPNVVTVNGEAFASALSSWRIAALVVAGGAIAGVASWIGALFNTARLDDKTWFVVLLVLGSGQLRLRRDGRLRRRRPRRHEARCGTPCQGHDARDVRRRPR